MIEVICANCWHPREWHVLMDVLGYDRCWGDIRTASGDYPCNCKKWHSLEADP